MATSCSGLLNDRSVEFKTDMEATYVWTDFNSPNLVFDTYTHSGKKVCRLDELTPYSPTLNFPLKELEEDFRFSKIKISIWIRAEKLDVNPAFVVDFSDEHHNNIALESKQLTVTALNESEWACYEYEFNVPADFERNRANSLRIYCMNSSKNTVFCDDFTVKLEP